MPIAKSTRTALVISPDDHFRRDLDTYLTLDGYLVFEAPTRKEGLSWIKEVCMDLVLLDCASAALPQNQLLRTLRRDCPDTRVILIDPPDEMHPTMHVLGLKEEIKKPILLDSLRKLLRNKPART